MPTYIYKCPVHGEIEVEQRITDPKLERCPRYVGHALASMDVPLPVRVDLCARPIERLISGGTGFQLKGSGWAKDGYK